MNWRALRSIGCFLLAALVAFLVGCGSSNDNSKTAGGATPEEVFGIAQRAAEKEDWKAYCSTMTVDSQTVFAAGIAVSATIMKHTADAEDAQKDTAMLEQHGITEDSIRGVMNDRSIKDPKEGSGLVLKNVKDHQQFVADMMATFKAAKELPHRANQSSIERSQNLKNVTINGDKATGTLETTGKPDKPIAFAKVDGEWLIDLLGIASGG